MTRLEKMEVFYNTLRCDNVDIAYYADEDHQSAEDLRSAIDDGDGFKIDIIYYSNAIAYLAEHDPSLNDSMGMASEMGYEVNNINSELLASLLASQNAMQDFYQLEEEIDVFFDELKHQESPRLNMT